MWAKSSQQQQRRVVMDGVIVDSASSVVSSVSGGGCEDAASYQSRGSSNNSEVRRQRFAQGMFRKYTANAASNDSTTSKTNDQQPLQRGSSSRRFGFPEEGSVSKKNSTAEATAANSLSSSSPPPALDCVSVSSSMSISSGNVNSRHRHGRRNLSEHKGLSTRSCLVNHGSSHGQQRGRRIHHHVAFSWVEIREYGRTLGDNPSCSSGPPIALDWGFNPNLQRYRVNAYEAKYGMYRRSEVELIIPRQIREEWMAMWGVKNSDIVRTVHEMIKIKNQRAYTVHKYRTGWEKVDTLVERTTKPFIPTGKAVTQAEQRAKELYRLHVAAMEQEKEVMMQELAALEEEDDESHPLDETFDYGSYFATPMPPDLLPECADPAIIVKPTIVSSIPTAREVVIKDAFMLGGGTMKKQYNTTTTANHSLFPKRTTGTTISTRVEEEEEEEEEVLVDTAATTNKSEVVFIPNPAETNHQRIATKEETLIESMRFFEC